MLLLVVRRVVKIQHKNGQVQYLKVQNYVPEHNFMVLDEGLAHNYLITIVWNCVQKIFVKWKRWKKTNCFPFLSIDVLILCFRIYRKLWNKLRFTYRTFDCVTAQVFLKTSKELFFSELLFTFHAFFIYVEVQRVFQNIA